uniref:Cytochrome c oxidase subunit 2 n=1 Tax=Runaria punctata TaxID=2950364 RepID=A0A977TL43_9HYME|nr:cytochrome c oxidase subunit II [Runaria punctata]UXW93349.1 cytochrome c oxidase subunit II [Runaria punctata]
MPTWSNLNLQNANSPLMEQMIYFYDHTMFILTTITMTIVLMMLTLIYNKLINRNLLNAQKTETMWTIAPAVTLTSVATPSMELLYLSDDTTVAPNLTFKITGHQWYWNYEVEGITFTNHDSFLVPLNTNNTILRTLETDTLLILPINTPIRLLVTSTDVIHSWTVPSLGIKIDAIPGRLNQITTIISRPGLFTGQCSEICGINHSFMPINLECVPLSYYLMLFNT